MNKRHLESEFRNWRMSGHPTDIDREAELDVGSCNFGNEKKRRRLLEEFAKNSSVHGTAYICHSGKKMSMCTKVFYRVLFVLSLILMVVNVVYLLKEKLTRESTYINNINKDIALGIAEDPEFFPIYPKITICREPTYKTDFNSTYLKFVEFAFLALGYPFVVLTPTQVSHLIHIVLHEQFKQPLDPGAVGIRNHLKKLEQKFEGVKTNDKDFDLRQFIFNQSVECEDFFLNCNAMVFSVNCCDVFRPVLTTLGQCYSLQKSQEIVDVIHQTPFEISFVVDLVSPPKLEKATAEGFIVFLDDPFTTDFELKSTKGQKAPPGLITTIKAELIRFQRSALYTSWHGGTTNCPKMPPGIMFKDNPERYSYHGCGSFYVAEKLMNACGCKWVLTPDLPEQRYCEPVDHYQCFIPSCLRTNLTDVSEKCVEPCISYHYRSDVSYVGLGLSNTSRIEIVYNAKQYISLEYRTTTLSGLFSQVGGALGLYLGASIITFAEIVIFVVCWIWYRIVPSSSPVLPTHHTKKMISA